MGNYIKIYIMTFIIFIGVDLIWLGLLAKDFYRDQLADFLRAKYNMKAAILFYVVYIAGIIFFVLDRAIDLGSWQYALFGGMFYGLITYATYGLTNYSTIKNWPLKLSIVDIAWGTILGGLTSYISYLVIIKTAFFNV